MTTTATALTRPGERERLSSKLKQIDWTFAVLLCVIAAIGTAMLYSVAPLAWQPWAGKHAVRFAICLALMLGLTLLNLRVWMGLAYPLYGLGLLICLAVPFIGRTSLGAKRWLQLGPIQIQPSEIMKIALVLALARFYHALSAKDARWSWKLLVPAAMTAVPMALIAKQPDLGTALLIGFTGAGDHVPGGAGLARAAGGRARSGAGRGRAAVRSSS